MPFLIDGHNLIPHVSGLSLQQLDDELALIERLDSYFKQQRKQAVVYFDRAQPGGSVDLRRAFLKVHFVRLPAIADDAILQHLKRLGGEAKNWVVVSSDLAVRKGAEKNGARVIPSPEFAALLTESRTDNPDPTPENNDIDDWLKIFGQIS